MRIQIGLRHGGGLLNFEVEQTADQFVEYLDSIRSGNGVIDLTDAKGDRSLVPFDSVAYISIPSDRNVRVGFARP